MAPPQSGSPGSSHEDRWQVYLGRLGTPRIVDVAKEEALLVADVVIDAHDVFPNIGRLLG